MPETDFLVVFDHRGLPVGCHDTLDGAKALVPEVQYWKTADAGGWDGFDPVAACHPRPAFKIRVSAVTASEGEAEDA